MFKLRFLELAINTYALPVYYSGLNFREAITDSHRLIFKSSSSSISCHYERSSCYRPLRRLDDLMKINTRIVEDILQNYEVIEDCSFIQLFEHLLHPFKQFEKIQKIENDTSLEYSFYLYGIYKLLEAYPASKSVARKRNLYRKFWKVVRHFQSNRNVIKCFYPDKFDKTELMEYLLAYTTIKIDPLLEIIAGYADSSNQQLSDDMLREIKHNCETRLKFKG